MGFLGAWAAAMEARRPKDNFQSIACPSFQALGLRARGLYVLGRRAQLFIGFGV